MAAVSWPHFPFPPILPFQRKHKTGSRQKEGGEYDDMRKEKGVQNKRTQQQCARMHLSACECVYKHPRCSN
eukprot:7282124-Ditylum_brightwellii.AAC.1